MHTSMRRVCCTLLVAAWASVPLQVYAQTAEDTVAFMLYGVHDGAQQYEVSVDFNSGNPQTRKTTQSTWKRSTNGLFHANVARGDHSSTLRVAVRRISNCEFSLVVSSIHDANDSDLDDETQITVNFSKISSIAYRGQHKETGLREIYGPLQIVTAAPNAICYEFRYGASSNPPTKTECLAEGRALFPTALPFYGLSRPPQRHEAALALFKEKFCAMRAS